MCRTNPIPETVCLTILHHLTKTGMHLKRVINVRIHFFQLYKKRALYMFFIQILSIKTRFCLMVNNSSHNHCRTAAEGQRNAFHIKEPKQKKMSFEIFESKRSFWLTDRFVSSLWSLSIFLTKLLSNALIKLLLLIVRLEEQLTILRFCSWAHSTLFLEIRL